MAISHICLDCGLDLARVRSSREPHYGLPLVQCPSCGAASVRRRHPLVVAWRRFGRVGFALMAGLLQLLLLAAFTALTMVFCVIAASQLHSGELPGPNDPVARSIILTLAVVLSFGIGIWLTAGLSHWRRPIAWMAFSCWMAVLMSLDALIVPALIAGMDELVDDHVAMPFRIEQLPWRFALFGGMMAIALAGIPLGHGFERLVHAARRQLWRNRRRRWRRRGIA